MLRSRIQLPALCDGQPTEDILSLSKRTEQFVEQTLLPAIRDTYDSLTSVAERMHFEPYRYCHSWHVLPQPSPSGLLTVTVHTALSRGTHTLLAEQLQLTVHPRTGQLVSLSRST